MLRGILILLRIRLHFSLLTFNIGEALNSTALTQIKVCSQRTLESFKFCWIEHLGGMMLAHLHETWEKFKSSKIICASHTWAKGSLRVNGLRKKLCDDLFCFSLMHMQCCLLCPFWALLLWKGCTIKQAILMCDCRSVAAQLHSNNLH